MLLKKESSFPSLQTDYINLDRSSGFIKIVREQTMFIKSAPFVELLITLQKHISKESERKSKNLLQMVIWKTKERNGRLGNFLDVDLRIT